MTEATHDSLRDLAQSTHDFYTRFGVVPEDPANLPGALRNFHEEVREFEEAARVMTDRDHIAEEAADVFVTAIGVCFAANVDVEQLIRQVYRVIAKNNAKTHQTHVLMAGKIRRRA
ncbi:MAG: hypothetical protein HXY40_17655 [Chloroflexi bacterium]|nr:hypothetical protein [Chloroflexota bacterium]